MYPVPVSGPVVDDPSCRVIYVDSVEVRMDDSGIMRIDFCAQRWNPNDRNDSAGQRMLVARVAMSLPLAGLLSDVLRRVTLENMDTSKSAGSWRPPPEWGKDYGQ